MTGAYVLYVLVHCLALGATVYIYDLKKWKGKAGGWQELVRAHDSVHGDVETHRLWI